MVMIHTLTSFTDYEVYIAMVRNMDQTEIHIFSLVKNGCAAAIIRRFVCVTLI